MKRLVPTCILFIFIIAVCIGSNLYVTNVCEDIYKEVAACRQAYLDDDYTLAVTVAADIQNRWHKVQEILAVFVNHSMLDDVSESTARLAAYTEDDIDAHFSTECADIAAVLHRICDEQHLLVESFY